MFLLNMVRSAAFQGGMTAMSFRADSAQVPERGEDTGRVTGVNSSWGEIGACFLSITDAVR
jgi:hypothetical protein